MARKHTRVSLAGRAARDKLPAGHEDATPERLRQARRHGTAKIDGQGIRRISDPFDLLHAHNLLDRADVVVNETLWHAGNRYRSHWHGAMLDSLSAFDPSEPVIDKRIGGAPGGLNPSEIALRHRTSVRRAMECVGPRLMPFVTGIVIEGRAVAALAGLVTDTAHQRTAEALALERLREGLHRLVDLWSMRARNHPLPIAAWHEGDG